MKCPYNKFNECFRNECPFYYKRYEIVDYNYAGKKDYVDHCKRSESEILMRGGRE